MRSVITKAYPEDSFIFADGFDDCIMGVDESTLRVIYSIDRCIDKLMASSGIDNYDQAKDFFYINVFNNDIEEGAPIFMKEYSLGEYQHFYLN